MMSSDNLLDDPKAWRSIVSSLPLLWTMPNPVLALSTFSSCVFPFIGVILEIFSYIFVQATFPEEVLAHLHFCPFSQFSTSQGVLLIRALLPFFEPRSYMVASNLCSCFCFPGIVIIGMCHHVWSLHTFECHPLHVLGEKAKIPVLETCLLV